MEEGKGVATKQKCWVIKYVVGNPKMFSKITTDAAGPILRSKAIDGAEKVARNGWRVWVEHATTGERIFESDVEKEYQAAAAAASAT